MVQDQLQKFGGDWTERKLEMLRGYLSAYTTALKYKRWKLAYIDAFAGTGYRENSTQQNDEEGLFSVFSAEEDRQKFLDGSASYALKTKPEFSKYVFMELSKKKYIELQKLREDYPEKANRIEILQGEANELLQEYCQKTNWRYWRSVLFLDPFGMQVEWKTLEIIAKTGAIDVWILFPVGVAANRLLMKDPRKIPDSWKRRLNLVFGSDEWELLFYEKHKTQTLLGKQEIATKTCTLESIAEYYHRKLKILFPNVADNPKMLKNSSNTPLIQLHFAASNSGRGGDIAIRIAQHILVFCHIKNCDLSS